MSKSIIHVSNSDGHRMAYLDLLTNIFGFNKLIQPVSRKNFSILVKTDKLLFATVGVAFYRYFLVCFFRAILNRPTAILFLGSSKYCSGGNSIFDLMLLKIWKVLPRQKLFSIISFNVVPKLSKVTNDYIYDPQIWDIWKEKQSIYSLRTELSKSIENKKKGREILLYLGMAKKSKSFIEFANMVLANSEYIYGVSAGKVLDECVDKADQLRNEGMMVVDRYVTDEDLFSLYSKADLVWCYYSPEYDQSSGVFGRAIQLGIPTIIRKGSIVEKMTKEFDVPAYPVEINPNSSYSNLFDKINKSKASLLSEIDRENLFEKLQNESIAKLVDALD